MLHRFDASAGEGTDYVRLGGKTVASVKGPAYSEEIIYLHADHLGSPAAYTDVAGVVVGR